MSAAELAARVTAARAAAGDFGREVDDYTERDGSRPDWQAWAFRLQLELSQLLGELDTTPGGTR